MAVISNNILAGASGQAGGAAGYQIERSLRFNSGDSSRLSISPSSTNRKTWTWSGWVKRSKLGGYDRLFGAETSSTAVTTIRFTALAGYEDCLEFHHTDGTNVSTVTTAAKLRDLSAWYHITVVVDTTQVLPANRTKIYINGIKQALSSTSYLNQDVLTFINSGNTTNIGRSGHYGAYFDGYLAEVNFLDGLTPGTATDDSDGSVSGIPDAEYLTDFGEFDADTGVWNPIEYTGSYPGNSFYLKFDDVSSITSIGQDSSGNGNNFTATNITVLGLPAPESDVITGVSQYTTPTYSDANNFTSTGSTSWTPPSGQRTGLFNIAGNSGLASYDPNQTIVWTPSTGIPCTTLELVIYDGQKSTGPMAVNGTYDIRPYVAQTQTGFSWVNIPNPPSTLTSITFSGGTGGVGWYGIRVNGVKLIDNNTVATLTLASNQNLAKFNVGDTVRQDNGVDYLAGTTADNGDATSSLYDGLVDTNTSTYIRPTTTMYFSNLPQASTSLRIYCWAQSGNQGNMVINGSDSGVSAGNGSWNWVTLNSLCPITMTSLSTVSGNVADGLFISAIEIDGSIVRSPSIGGTAAVIDTSANTITVSQSAGTWSANTSNYVVGPSTLNTSSDLDTLFDSPTNGNPTLDTGLGGELSGNYCVLNAIDSKSATLTNGNLEAQVDVAGANFVRGTIAVSSGKHYWEFTILQNSNMALGVAETTGTGGLTDSGSYYYYANGGTLYGNSTGKASSWNGSTLAVGDVLGVALDMSNGTLQYYKNGSLIGTAWTGLTGKTLAPAIGTGGGSNNRTACNFGQRPFAFQNVGVNRPSADFKALCTANLPDPDIADGSTAFDVVTYNGTGSNLTVSGVNFSSDLLWIKCRNTDFTNHTLADSVRGLGSQGAYKRLFTSTNGGQADDGYDVSAISSTGFTVVPGDYGNRSGRTFVAWAWKAGEAPTTDNVAGAGNVPTAGSAKVDGSNMTTALAGTIPIDRLSVNTSAKFSIATFTGNNTSGATVAHGLGQKPAFYIVKRTNTTEDWFCHHENHPAQTSSPGSFIKLNFTELGTTNASVWNNTDPTDEVITLGNNTGVNALDSTYVMYAWAPVKSYSSFGRYTGNGNSDGAFVHTGMRPRYLLVKRVTGGNAPWFIFDSERPGYNVIGGELYANDDIYEGTGARIDFLSNGFKFRDTGSSINSLSSEYIYAAFAENPFKYARAA